MSASPVAGSSSADLLEEIELQTAVLVRSLEMLRRRSDFYTEVDRAGYLLLRTLEKMGPADIGTLASALGLDPSTTGRQVNTAQKAGLVVKAPDSDDLRRAVVTVTKAGSSAMRAVRHRRLQGTAQMLSEWSARDLTVLAAMFTRYNQAIIARYMNNNPEVDAVAEADGDEPLQQYPTGRFDGETE